MAKIRREYSGGAVSTTTTNDLLASNGGSVTVSLNAVTGWPFGSNKFFVVFSPGTANEEKVLVSRASSGDTSITVASNSDRGQDDTVAALHASGATVYPVFTAVDADEANELTSKYESKGDLVSLGAATFERLAVGTNDYVLQADSSTASGLTWGLVGTDNLAADAVTAAKIAASAVGTSELATGAVTLAKLNSGLVQSLVPVGTISATVRATADSGWLLLDGSTVVGAQSTYPQLWNVIPTSWKSGSDMVLPDMASKMLFGQGGTALGATGGSNTVSILETNLPAHKHSLNAHTHTIAHTHSLSAHTHSLNSHTHDVNPGAVTSGDPSQDVVHRISGGYPSPPSAEGQQYRIPDQYLEPVTNGMAIYANDFTHTHSVDVANTTSGGPSNNASGAPSSDTTGSSSAANTGASTGDTGNTGSNAALTVTNAHLAVNFQIKFG